MIDAIIAEHRREIPEVVDDFLWSRRRVVIRRRCCWRESRHHLSRVACGIIRRRNTVTRQLLIYVRVNRALLPDLKHLAERLVDKDEGDEHGKALLRESCDVAHQGTEVKQHEQ